MKQVSTELQAVIAAQNIAFRANLYTLTLTGPLAGLVLYLTDGDQDLTLDGVTYLCGAGAPASTEDATLDVGFDAPFGGISAAAGEGSMGLIRRSRSRVASDLSIDDADIFLSIMPVYKLVSAPGPRLDARLNTRFGTAWASWVVDRGQLANDLPLPKNALLGSFDGCGVRIDAAFMSTYGDLTAGAVPDVVGLGYPADISSTQLRLSVKGIGEKLMTPLPRRLVQLNCPYDFCDSRCTLSRSRYAAAYACAAGCTKTTLSVSGTAPTLQSAYASVWFTTGALAGQHRPLSSTAYPLKLQVGLPFAPAAGDNFTLRGGCDKSRTGRGTDTSHCCQAYSNVVNYGGFPDTPSAALQGGK